MTEKLDRKIKNASEAKLVATLLILAALAVCFPALCKWVDQTCFLNGHLTRECFRACFAACMATMLALYLACDIVAGALVPAVRQAHDERSDKFSQLFAQANAWVVNVYAVYTLTASAMAIGLLCDLVIGLQSQQLLFNSLLSNIWICIGVASFLACKLLRSMNDKARLEELRACEQSKN